MSLRIDQLVLPNAERRGNAVAIVDRAVSLTYSELWSRAEHVAAVLSAAGLRRNDRVCLMIPKSADAIAVVLGVLKSGGVYVPIDCASPAARIASMLATCAPAWVVVDPNTESLLDAALAGIDTPGQALHGVVTLTAPFDFRLTAARGDDFGESSEAPEFANLAYILFTSGSTGTPKGVPITHQNVVQYVDWTNRHFCVTPDDRISSHAPLHFDMSVWDMFGTFAAGATLVLVPPEANLTPGATAAFMRQADLTQWYSVPSVLVGMASRDVVRRGDFPSLKRIIWGGEAFPVPALRYWMDRLPHAVFTNVFGPTEATVNCSYYTVPRPLPESVAHVPIGAPIPGRRLRILSDDGSPAKSGEIGQLYIGGQGLSPGYWRDPVRTAAAFIEFDSDPGERWYRTGDLARVDDEGIYHFRGRSDRQIKTRGYRIELDEVAAALARLPYLEQSAVVAVPVGGFEGMRICAAFVPAAGHVCSAVDLKTALGEVLPSYMIPRRWMPLDTLPTNVNGKVDLTRLQELFADGQ